MWALACTAWISTAAAVSVGIYYTNSAWCLWAMLIPSMLSFSRKPVKTKKAEIAP